MRNRPVPVLKDSDRAYVERLLVETDGDVLVFNKPSGLPVQTRGNRGRNLDYLLWAFARSNGKRPKLVHRLDTGTSGVILAARTHPAAVHLSAQFQDRTVEKQYLAVVHDDEGLKDRGTVDAPLLAKAGGPPMAHVDAKGKSALTDWCVLKRSEGYALIEARPRSGRMHQIRAHMAHISHPLLGDPQYGGRRTSRLMLHALSVSIESINEGRKTYRIEPSEDWLKVLETFGLA